MFYFRDLADPQWYSTPDKLKYPMNTSFNNTQLTKKQNYAIAAKNTRLYTPSPTACPAPSQTALPTILGGGKTG